MHNHNRDTPGSERRKGNKERTKGTRRPSGLNEDNHLGRTKNTGSDQMSSENYFKVFDRVHENIAQYASSLF